MRAEDFFTTFVLEVLYCAAVVYAVFEGRWYGGEENQEDELQK